VKADIGSEVDGIGSGTFAELLDDCPAVHSYPPLAHRLDAVVDHAPDFQVSVCHRFLLTHVANMSYVTVGHPQPEVGVDGPLVGTAGNPAEEATVGSGVVAVEVVRLAPGLVGLDWMLQVVAFIENGHGVPQGSLGLDQHQQVIFQLGSPPPAGG
jgi:hypothetical protein